MPRLGPLLVSVVIVGAAAIAVSAAPAVTSATDGGGANDADGTIRAVVTVGGDAGPAGSGGAPACRWVPAADGLTTAGPEGATTRIGPLGPEVLYLRSCPDRPPLVRWVPQVPPLGELRRAARDEVTRRVPPPEPRIDPPVDVGGLVNLGVWLAVADPGPVVATASIGPHWVTVTATLSSTRFDPGDGSPAVRCPGAGSPLADPRVPTSGPCGHVYRRTAQQAGLGAAYPLTVTARWSTSARTSTGAAYTLLPVDRTVTVDYHVAELTTAGAD